MYYVHILEIYIDSFEVYCVVWTHTIVVVFLRSSRILNNQTCIHLYGVYLRCIYLCRFHTLMCHSVFNIYGITELGWK